MTQGQRLKCLEVAKLSFSHQMGRVFACNTPKDIFGLFCVQIVHLMMMMTICIDWLGRLQRGLSEINRSRLRERRHAQ